MRGHSKVLLVSVVVASALPWSSSVVQADVDAGRRICVGVETGAPGDLAVVNLTPVLATAPGNGQLISSNVAVPPEASNVNFAPGTVDPNVAVAPIGADRRICFANSADANVHVIVDLLTVVGADSYRANPGDGAPLRLVDTRIGQGGRRLTAGERRCFDAKSTVGDTVVVNLTPVGASGRGFGVLTSSGIATAPTASSVNFAPGTVDPNVAIAEVGADGQVCFHNSVGAAVDLVADLLVTMKRAALATQVNTPVRLLDTRLTGERVAGGGQVCMETGATPGDTAIVNLTPVNAAGPGFGYLGDRPVAEQLSPISNVNFGPGTVDPNLAVVTIGAGGVVCFTNGGTSAVDLVADLLATVHASSIVVDPITEVVPIRLLDTRPEQRDVATCVTTTRCYAVGDQFYASDDGGRTWQLAEAAAPYWLAFYRESRALSCSHISVCTFVASAQLGRETRTFVTLDFGRHWSEPRMNVVNHIVCPNAAACLAGGASGTFSGLFTPSFRRAIALTTDRGATWRRIALPDTTPPGPGQGGISDIDCPAPDRCIATSNANGTITVLTLTTADDWQTVDVRESAPI